MTVFEEEGCPSAVIQRAAWPKNGPKKGVARESLGSREVQWLFRPNPHREIGEVFGARSLLIFGFVVFGSSEFVLFVCLFTPPLPWDGGTVQTHCEPDQYNALIELGEAGSHFEPVAKEGLVAPPPTRRTAIGGYPIVASYDMLGGQHSDDDDYPTSSVGWGHGGRP